MKILVTNNHLKMLAGSETFTYTLANELKRQGHQVEVFTLHPGLVSAQLRAEGFKILTKKSDLGKYDLILANHTTCVQMAFQKGFTIQTCHGLKNKLEQPSKFAHFHVAISEEISKKLHREGYSNEVILNGVNCVRFSPKLAVNPIVKKVLSLSFSEPFNDALRFILSPYGIAVTTLNKYKNPVWDVEDYINDSDLVISLGRGVYESMACGRPVVVFDMRKYQGLLGDGLIKPDNIKKIISHNCSGRSLKNQNLSPALYEAIIYINENPGVLNAFSREYALKNLNIEHQAEKYIQLVDRNYKFNSEEKYEDSGDNQDQERGTYNQAGA